MAHRKLKQCIHSAYVFLMLYILFALVVLSENVEYPCKQGFLWPNWAILLIAVMLILAIACFLYFARRKQTLIRPVDPTTVQRTVLCGCVVFAIVQIYVSYNYYFLTDWDVDLIYQSAREIVNGTFGTSEQYGEFCWYYSTYPNNMELLGVFVACLKVNQYFGVLDPQNGVMIFVTLNCVIVAATGLLLYAILSNHTSWRWGLLGWLVFVAYIGASPWVTIPYSDSLGLLFPTAEVWICGQIKRKQRKWPYFILLGVVGGVGYHLKPQVVIVLIAAALLFLLEILCSKQDRMKRTLGLAAVLLAFLLSGVIPKAVDTALDIPLDENRRFGAIHFVMMGMNPETEGVYSQEDCIFSHSFGDTTARKNGEIKVIKERLAEYGIGGYVKLLNKKLLTTYGDGSFAWGMEGGFWREILPLKNDGISRVTREFYYNTGHRYGAFLTYMQLFWIAVLLLQAFANKAGGDEMALTVELSIIGLTVFELIFEARARYLYTYAPLYIFMTVCGLRNLKKQAQAKICRAQ